MAAATRVSANQERQRAELASHATMLRRYLFVLGTDESRVNDLIQEVFLVVLRKHVEQGDRKAFAAFLRGCAKNMRLRELRSVGARREVELADEVWNEATECRDARVDALRRCVADLPERSRKVLRATYTDGMSRAATAQLLGMRDDGIKTMLRRLREGLRDCVARRLGGNA